MTEYVDIRAERVVRGHWQLVGYLADFDWHILAEGQGEDDDTAYQQLLLNAQNNDLSVPADIARVYVPIWHKENQP